MDGKTYCLGCIHKKVCGLYPAKNFGCVEFTPSADVPDRNVGKWSEKEVIHAEEAKTAIEEWQTCRCSVCGRYDTRPYLYYFSKPNYCSFCGAYMREEE